MGTRDSHEGLLSIGEVARMKGVSVKQLRYYDRIGVLKPAYISPESGYRYYTLRQAAFVDLVLYCIDLGIPLGELAGYQLGEGRFDLPAILARGRRASEERLEKIMAALRLIDSAEDEIQSQVDASETPHGPDGARHYQRRFPGGSALCLPWEEGGVQTAAGDLRGVSAVRLTKRLTDLYDLALKARATPLWAEGLLRSEGLWWSFLEVDPGEHIPCDEDAMPGGACLLALPEGEMACHSLRTRSVQRGYDFALLRANESGPEGPAIIQQIWEPVFDVRRATVEVALLPAAM